MDGLLRLLGESKWNRHLVLRGSRLMAEWFPDEARNPGDLDWVVVPRSIHADHLLARELLAGTIGLIEAQPLFGEASIAVTGITSDQIWSYERCPGVRVMVPWKADGIPGGVIQMDFVFGERLWIDPVAESVKLCDGSSVKLNVVPPELALLWKMLWLYCDISPQGKDVYDAVLLAETASFSLPMLKNALQQSDSWWVGRDPSLSALAVPEWEAFITEYPWIPGDEEYWIGRLIQALQPSFEPRQE
ncbi:MAG TPA: nucleotidyl transferase AbiEii/AbiGii toxin family protein [Planctomycetaceae bacterium]|nr:nucleotidyl transferase AbiEii/AbiGii toxin family protein [Planctomycetaceae bacterium]